jgi:hypothetical protein
MSRNGQTRIRKEKLPNMFFRPACWGVQVDSHLRGVVRVSLNLAVENDPSASSMPMLRYTEQPKQKIFIPPPID